MFSIRPTTARLLRRVRAKREVFEVADEVVELEPASTFDTVPAICLAGELDRVTRFVGDEKEHRARLLGGLRREGPTLSYGYDGALLADFTAYVSGSYQVFREIKKRAVITGVQDHFVEAQLCTTVCAQMYFGHFFHDSLVLEELAARRNLEALTFSQKPWLHEPSYRRLFEREAISVSSARVDRLWLVDERTLNCGWRSRFGALRARLRDNVAPTGARNVFITRGFLFSGRSLANEQELAELLERQGFIILEPEKKDPSEIASVLRDAQLVVCVAGSAEVHALVAMPAGATLIEIQIAPFFGTIGKILTESIDVRWGYVVAEETSTGFRLEPDRLIRTLELVS